MKNKRIVASVFVILFFSVQIYAQQPAENKFVWPTISLEQDKNYAVYQRVVTECSVLAHAKSLGKTVKQYGNFVGELFAPSYAPAKGKGVAPLITSIYRRFHGYPGVQTEIVSESPTSIEAKTNRPYKVIFKDGTFLGITIDEYEDFMEASLEPVAKYLGLEFKTKKEADWIYVTITEKK